MLRISIHGACIMVYQAELPPLVLASHEHWFQTSSLLKARQSWRMYYVGDVEEAPEYGLTQPWL